jgi:hypothetical protein
VVVIRCTQKLLGRVQAVGAGNATSTTRLGDWSANLVGVRRRRFVLLVSEHSRLPIIVPARDVTNLAAHLVGALAPVLLGLGIRAVSVRRELSEMREFIFTRTNNRSVLASINDFARTLKWRLYDNPDLDFTSLALWLSQTPILVLGGKSPDVLTQQRFR